MSDFDLVDVQDLYGRFETAVFAEDGTYQSGTPGFRDHLKSGTAGHAGPPLLTDIPDLTPELLRAVDDLGQIAYRGIGRTKKTLLVRVARMEDGSYAVSFRDETNMIRDRQTQVGRETVLELAASGEPLERVLEKTVLVAEKVNPGVICSILLVDRKRGVLLHGAAPHLPDFYNNAVHELPYGKGVGTCGHTAAVGKPTFIEDIMTHPNWAPFTEIAEEVGLRANWSQPIFDEDGTVIGTFAMYYREPKLPDAWERRFIVMASKLAGILIRWKRAEAQLSEARDSAEVSSRSKSEFLAHMSHELRTPLNAVIGMSELILHLEETLTRTTTRQYLEDIRSSGHHLLEIIEDLLEISSIETGRRKLHEEVFDATNAAHACIRMVQARATDAKIAITISRAEENPLPLLGERRAFNQILLNLLNNAIRYSGADTTVTVDLSSKKGFTLEVRDTGRGMDSVQLEALDTAFARTNNPQISSDGGLGIGLTIVRQLTELHGGTVQIDSRRGKGTQVTVEWPAERLAVNDGQIDRTGTAL